MENKNKPLKLKTGAVVIRRSGDSWKMLVGYTGEGAFIPKGHQEQHLGAVAQARMESLEEAQHYPLTCQGLLCTSRYSYPDDSADVLLDWYLFTDAVELGSFPFDDFDRNVFWRWLEIPAARTELTENTVPRHIAMNTAVLDRLEKILGGEQPKH